MKSSKRIPYVTIAKAHSEMEAIRFRMLFDRIQIPYRVRGEHLYSVMLMGIPAMPSLEFEVPEDLQEAAQAALAEVFDLNPDEIPENCPACFSKTRRGSMDCPECGLFLA